MHFLITAGPTREPIDPVRYLSNHSSGKMGYCIAHEAIRLGHKVTLISGPTSLDIPSGVDFLPVETAQEMYDATKNYISKADIAIFSAAVADYRPISVSEEKIKKSSDSMSIEFTKNPDILASARSIFKFEGTLVGFAAETQNVIDNARKKLVKKQCNFVVANDVSRSDIGFNSSHNEVTFVYPEKEVAVPKADKIDIAHEIVKECINIKS